MTQGVTKWNTYIRSYLIRRFFTTYERLIFRSCTSAYVEYVNLEYVPQGTLKIIPRTYLKILKQHTQQRHFVCNFSLPSIVETRSFYCLSKKILLRHLDKNSCEHVNRTKIFDHRVLACLQFRTYIFCLVVILYIYGFMTS